MWEFIRCRGQVFWFSLPYVLSVLRQRDVIIDPWFHRTVSPSVARNVALPESMPQTHSVLREEVFRFQRRLTLIGSCRLLARQYSIFEILAFILFSLPSRPESALYA